MVGRALVHGLPALVGQADAENALVVAVQRAFDEPLFLEPADEAADRVLAHGLAAAQAGGRHAAVLAPLLFGEHPQEQGPAGPGEPLLARSASPALASYRLQTVRTRRTISTPLGSTSPARLCTTSRTTPLWSSFDSFISLAPCAAGKGLPVGVRVRRLRRRVAYSLGLGDHVAEVTNCKGWNYVGAY